MPNTFIMIQDPVAIFFIMAFIVILSLWLERSSPFLKKMGSASLCIIMGIILSNSTVIPGESPVYDFLMSEAVTASIVLILLSVSIKSLRMAGSTMLKAFLVGSIGSALGGITMSYLLNDAIGSESWKLAGQFTGTYIGGGMNFAALGNAFQTTSSLFTAGIAADVILTAIWLIVCLAAPLLLGSKEKATSLPEEDTSTDDQPKTLEKALYNSLKAIPIQDMAAFTGITIGCMLGSDLLAEWMPFLPKILWLTTLALLMGQLPVVRKLSGGAMLGNYLLLLFLASNGAKSVVANIVAVGPAIFYFALGTIFIHGIFIFGVGKLLKIDAAVLAVASQANVGGSSSALALASARGYGDLVLPGVAVGLLGYAVGNYLGFFVGNMMQGIL